MLHLFLGIYQFVSIFTPEALSLGSLGLAYSDNACKKTWQMMCGFEDMASGYLSCIMCPDIIIEDKFVLVLARRQLHRSTPPLTDPAQFVGRARQAHAPKTVHKRHRNHPLT